MVFSRLGKPERLQAAGLGAAQPDDLAVGPHHRAQPRLQPTDLQCLALAQARFLGGTELGARQVLQQRG